MDYKRLGFRCGLEIHQQLSSATKLFCRCPITRSEYFPIELRRKLRAVPGELGDFDPAALQEYLRNRTFIYKASNDSCCLVELDDDPPKQMNEKALMTGIQMCRLMHCHIIDELHVMRKTVVDGSAPSGFQRTALLGVNGYIEGEFGKIGVQTITLEEDAGTPISKGAGIVEYRLDRLGIPLIEIATSSDIESPQMAKQVAEHIGMLLRSTDVMRGIGTIRQDINISIEGGERIEIKGFQELDKIPDVIDNEIMRQLALLEIREELRKRGLHEVKSEPKDVTQIFLSSKSNFISRVIADHGRVYAMKLEKFATLLKKPCGDRTFGKELSSYAASYGLGIMHSDEDVAKYGLAGEFAKLHTIMEASEHDLVLITAGNDVGTIMKALDLVAKRAQQCITGIPKETRTADGIGSVFTRPLPGSGRLYPESDVPPIRIGHELLSVEIPEPLNKQIEKRIKYFVENYKMSGSVARFIITSKTVNGPDIAAIGGFAKNYPNVRSDFIAKMVFEIPKELKSRFNLELNLRDGIPVYSKYYEILDALNKGKIVESSVVDIFVDHLKGEPLDKAIEKYELLTERELRKIIKNIVEENPGKKESILMGLVMKHIKGRASGAEISKILREMITE